MSKLLVKLPMNRAVLYGLMLFAVCTFGLSASASAQLDSMTSENFPSQEAYNAVNGMAKNIAQDLCKDKKDKNACEKGYIKEYLYLAYTACNNESTNTKKISCFKNFAKDNTKLGKARQAAGFDPDQRVDSSSSGGDLTTSNIHGKATHQCGKGDNAVKTKFNFGCVGNSYSGSRLNPILDVSYAIIKFLAAGVGILVVGSIIWAGIQYSSSQGNPEQTQAAKSRIQNSIIGLVLYLFIFALVQYLVPGGIFNT